MLILDRTWLVYRNVSKSKVSGLYQSPWIGAPKSCQSDRSCLILTHCPIRRKLQCRINILTILPCRLHSIYRCTLINLVQLSSQYLTFVWAVGLVNKSIWLWHLIWAQGQEPFHCMLSWRYPYCVSSGLTFVVTVSNAFVVIDCREYVIAVDFSFSCFTFGSICCLHSISFRCYRLSGYAFFVTDCRP